MIWQQKIIDPVFNLLVRCGIVVLLILVSRLVDAQVGNGNNGNNANNSEGIVSSTVAP
jgi:hypothetical protein